MFRANGIMDAPLPESRPTRGGTDTAAGQEDGNAGYRRRLLDGIQSLLAGLRRLPGSASNSIRDFVAGLGDPENYKFCAFSCFYFLFCHAIVTLVLNICCCFCLKSVSENLAPEPKNGVQKFFASTVKLLSNLWVTALLFLMVWSIFFRPFDVKPRLGASTVHEFELQSPASINMSGSHTHAAAAPPHLRFNLTTYFLFKNKHSYYKIGYNRLAIAVFYADEKIGPVDDELPSFKQKPGRSTVMCQAFVGRLRNASGTVADTFARERLQERFEIVLRIRVSLTYKFWPFKGEYFNVYDCPLSSRPPQVGEPALQSPSAWCKTVKI